MEISCSPGKFSGEEVHKLDHKRCGVLETFCGGKYLENNEIIVEAYLYLMYELLL